MKTNEDKIQFKNHFFKLGQGRVISSEHDEFWSKFYRAPESCNEIYELISNNDVRTIRQQNLSNLIIFVRILISRIIYLSNCESLSSLQITELLNCLRFVNRLLPLLFELENYLNNIEIEIFWNDNFDPVKFMRSQESSDVRAKSPVVIDGSLAHRFMTCLINLLFTKGFTTESKHPGGKQMSVWEPGIGCLGKPIHKPNSIIDCNRIEVLRLLITLCCSPSFYTKPTNVIPQGSKFLTILVSSIPKFELLTLFTSLINTVCKKNDEVSQTRNSLKTCSFQLLTSMIVYPIPRNNDIKFQSEKPKNLVRLYVGKIHKENELRYLADSLIDILRMPIWSEDGLMSMITNKSLSSNLWSIESAMILWEIIQCNKHFKALIESKYLNELSMILIFYIINYHNSNDLKNLIRVCSFFLLYLTNINLDSIFRPINLEFYESLPNNLKLSITPITTRDFIVSQLCKFLINASTSSSSSNYLTSKPISNLLLSTLVNILYNIIPQVSTESIVYKFDPVKKLQNFNPNGGVSYQSSSLLIQLIGKFSTKQFLLENSIHLDLLALLIRSTCIAILKHPKPSRMLLFCILKNEKMFDELWNTIFSFDHVCIRGGTLAKIEDDAEFEITQPSNLHQEPSQLSDPESIENSLKPTPPTGMSDKAKEKSKKDQPLQKSWSGNDSLTIILTIMIPFLKLILNEVWSGVQGSSIDSTELIQRIEKGDFQELIESNKSQINCDYLPDTPLEILKFEWNYLSLGWYTSLLYGQIYNTNNLKQNKAVKNFASISNWFTKINETSSNTMNEWINNSLINTNIYENTSIKLFNIEKKSEGFFNFSKGTNSNNNVGVNFNSNLNHAVPSTPNGLNDMAKRINEFRFNGKSSPISTPIDEDNHSQSDSFYNNRRVGRNSITSLHSLNTLNRTRSNTPRNSFSQ